MIGENAIDSPAETCAEVYNKIKYQVVNLVSMCTVSDMFSLGIYLKSPLTASISSAYAASRPSQDSVDSL